MSHERPESVVDGKLVSTSATEIEQFDTDTETFACNRKWWFRFVGGIQEERNGGADWGQNFHEQVENHFYGHPYDFGAYDTLLRPYLPTNMEGTHLLEYPIDSRIINGTWTRGHIDWLRVKPDGSVQLNDWKTTKKVAAKKKKVDLSKKVQLFFYASSLPKEFKRDRYSLRHIYIQQPVEGENFNPFIDEDEVIVTAEQVEREARRIDEVVQRMQTVASQQVVQVEKTKLKFVCKYCPYQERCSNADREDLFMGLFSATKKIEEPKVEPEIITSEHAVEIEVITSEQRVDMDEPVSILPPDAPKSDPKLAAEPPKMAKGGKVKIKSVTVNKELTINLGNYSSAKVGLAITGEGEVADIEKLVDAELQRMASVYKPVSK